jgi:protein ImuB
MRRRILCLYFPDWPIQRLRGALEAQRSEVRGRRPEVQGPKSKVQSQKLRKSTTASHAALRILHSALPVVLYSRDPRRGDVVVVCDATAYERGVRVGMLLAEAAALAEHGGECLMLPHEPATDLTELAGLAECCERFSPIVGWQTAEGVRNAECGMRSAGPECLFLDVTGIGVLFGGEEQLGREIVADLARLGYEGRVAVSDTIGAAWAAARQSFKFHVSSFTLDDHDDSTWNLELGTWNLDSLRLPAETVDLLSQLGIERLEQLLTLPRESLRARFGELLLLRIDQLLGAAQEVIVPYRSPPQFSEEWLLEYPAEKQDVVEQILCDLVQRIATALACRREGVLKLGCRLDCAPGRAVMLEVGLFRPSADQKHLWDLLKMQLEQAALPGPVGRVRLEAALTAPLENRQGELFAGGEHEAQRQFALLIDRCSSRLGSSAVLQPQLTADPLPERAVRYKARVRQARSGERGVRNSGRSKAQGPKSKARRQESDHSAFHNPHPALLRPLMLHSPPEALEVLSVAPDGPPVSFRFQRQKHEVVGRSGPERIETGWWRGKSVRRDYWRVETAAGQRFWLFRQLADGQWFLHGEYA